MRWRYCKGAKGLPPLREIELDVRSKMLGKQAQDQQLCRSLGLGVLKIRETIL